MASDMRSRKSPPNGSRGSKVWTKEFVSIFILLIFGCVFSFVLGSMNGWEHRINYEALQCADKLSLCP